MARVRITKLPKALSGLEMKMSAGLYGKGTNGNPQFRKSSYLEAGKISQQPTEVRDTLQPVAREGANLEAEKGETAMVNIDGIPAHFKIGGKRHSQGGTPLNLPDNSFIFSDTAKMKIKDPIMLAQFGMVPKKSGYTPAEIAKKYDINKLRQVLADPNTTDLERKTAEMMIANYNMKLAKLALLQESSKGFPQGIPVVAMPYVMATGMNPEEFAEIGTQGEEEQPDADMGEQRYGGNIVSQFNTKQYGGLPTAQVGAINKPPTVPTGTTGATSYNVPLQVNPKDIQYTEPDWATKTLQGVNAVLEFPQRLSMYAGTGLFGDDYYEMYNPYTNKKEMVHEENVDQWIKSGYQPTGVKTGFSDRAHYEMPGETLERTYPKSSPALRFAADVFVDPLVPYSMWKTAGRLATKKISKPLTQVIYKNEGLLNKQEAIKEALGSKITKRQKEIASKVYDKVMDTYKKNPSATESKLLKVAAPTAHNAAIAHDVTKAAETAALKAQQAKVYAIEKAKQAYDVLHPLAKKVVKGTKEVAEKVYNVVDDPFLGPTLKVGTKNVIGTGAKSVAGTKAKEEAKQYKAQAEYYKAQADSLKQKADSLNLLIKKPKEKVYIQTPGMTDKQFLESLPTQTTEPVQGDW